MFGGLTVNALVTGVPFGTFGQHLAGGNLPRGIDSRGDCANQQSILVPNNIPGRASASLRDQMKVLTILAC